MDKYISLNFIAIIIVFISLLLTFFLLTVKSKNRLANVLLASFVIICALDVSGIIIGPHLKAYPELYEFTKSFTFLIFPIFYYYVLSICYNNFKLKNKSLLHLLPFVLYNLLILTDLFFAMCELNFIFWIFNAIILKLQALFYLIVIVAVLKNYKKVFLENYANGSIFIYKWLSGIVIVLLITLPISLFKEFSVLGNHQEVFNWTMVILTIIALIMLSWFVLKALYNPEIFRGIDPEIKPTSDFLPKKNENKVIETESDAINIAMIEQLKVHMMEKEPFLEPTLTLQELALQMNIPARKLSILINQHAEQHFFDFVNKYRIKKATEIIENSAKNEFTIQQIYFEVGFNSKSSFNTAFKKHTQLTPSEYRNQLAKK